MRRRASRVWGGLKHLRWGGRSYWLFELPVLLMLAAAIPMQGYFQQTDGYNYPSELWLLFGLFGLAAVGISAIYHLLLHQTTSRMVAAVLAFLAVMLDFDARAPYGSGVLGVILPHSDNLLAFVIITAVCWALGAGLERLAKRWAWITDRQTYNALRLVALGVLLTNCFLLWNYLGRMARADNFVPKNTTGVTQVQATAKRDVYYIVLDRYANNSSLAKYYNYDDSTFLSFLKQEGFTVRDGAYSNYQFTAPSIASTMRMDYHTDIQQALGDSTTQSYLPYRKILENSPVSQLFASAGYTVTRVASWYGVTRDDNYGQVQDPQFTITLFGGTFTMSDLQSAVIDHTFFAPWFRQGVHLGPLTIALLNAHNTAQLVLDQLRSLEKIAATPHDRPQFVFAHILSPHPPYVFLPSGSQPSYSVDDNDGGAPRELKYINQLKFVNTQVEMLVKKLKAASAVPPVIIIQADEGPYPPEFADFDQKEGGSYPWEKAAADTLQHKYGILAAYYLPDVPAEDKDQLNSSVNAFRFVFNHYFTGANLPYLPDCSLLFNGHQPFAFWDATARLRGNEDPSCQSLAARGVLK